MSAFMNVSKSTSGLRLGLEALELVGALDVVEFLELRGYDGVVDLLEEQLRGGYLDSGLSTRSNVPIISQLSLSRRSIEAIDADAKGRNGSKATARLAHI